MSDSFFSNGANKSSKDGAWVDKTSSETTRFHHLICPPEGDLDGWYIVSTGQYSSPEPAINAAYWNIGKAKGKDAVIGINVMEYASIAKTHQAIISKLMSFTRRGLDFSPKMKAPGDVLILNIMARDNVRIEIASVGPLDPYTEQYLLKKVDEWLMGNWPLLASKVKSSNPQPLAIKIRPKVQAVSRRELVQLFIEVEMNGSKLELKDLPHRFSANPGRIIWKDNTYFYSSDHPGKSEITLDVVSPQGGYGHGSITLELKK